jgi:sRNA-binding protein
MVAPKKKGIGNVAMPLPFFPMAAMALVTRKRVMNRQRLITALALVATLAKSYPLAFAIEPRRRRPLKIGIHHDLMAALGAKITDSALTDALALYVGNPGYLKASIAGADRIDLAGKPAGQVTAKQADIAKARLDKQRHAAAKPVVERIEPVKSDIPAEGKPVVAAVAQAEPAKSRRVSLADLRAAARARKTTIVPPSSSVPRSPT